MGFPDDRVFPDMGPSLSQHLLLSNSSNFRYMYGKCVCAPCPDTILLLTKLL